MNHLPAPGRSQEERTSQRGPGSTVKQQEDEVALVVGRPRAARDLLALLTLVSFWAATHPYLGIIHDARLYMVQALHSLDPRLFADDLYLRHGSQDSFSAFSFAYTPFIKAFGAPNAHLTVAIIGQALWMTGLLRLLLAIFSDRKVVFVAALAAIGMHSGYAGLDVFHYGERFATPRLFAEAFVLLALASGLRARLFGCCVFLLAAFALHPLMALGGAGVIFVLATFHDRRAWLLAGFGVATLLCLATAGVGPFGRLLLYYDPAWWATIYERSPFVLITHWHPADFLRVVSTLAVLATAITVTGARERRLLAGVAITASLAIVASVLGTDLAHNVLATNLQMWRALWLTSLFANIYTGAFAVQFPRGSATRELFLSSALFSAASLIISVPLEITSCLTLAGCASALVERQSRRHVSSLARNVVRFRIIFAIMWVASACFVRFRGGLFPASLISLASIISVIVAIFLIYKTRQHTTTRLFVALLLLSTPFALIDQRTPSSRYVESTRPDPGLENFVSNTGNLYWERGVELLWIKLNKTSYYSCVQGAGSMFYKGTAASYERISKGLSVLNSSDFSDDDDSMCWKKHRPGIAGPNTASEMRAACRSLPELDTIVLAQPIVGVPPSGAWTSPTPLSLASRNQPARSASKYYKYSCLRFR